jgi:hypothetical protein
MFEEALKFFKFISCLCFGVRDIILTWSELWNHIDYIIQAKLAHVVIITHSVLYNLYLYLKHWQSIHSYQLDIVRYQNDNIWQIESIILSICIEKRIKVVIFIIEFLFLWFLNLLLLLLFSFDFWHSKLFFFLFQLQQRFILHSFIVQFQLTDVLLFGLEVFLGELHYNCFLFGSSSYLFCLNLEVFNLSLRLFLENFNWRWFHVLVLDFTRLFNGFFSSEAIVLGSHVGWLVGHFGWKVIRWRIWC